MKLLETKHDEMKIQMNAAAAEAVVDVKAGQEKN